MSVVFVFQIGKLSPRDVKRFAQNSGPKLKISRPEVSMATAKLCVQGSGVISTDAGLVYCLH